MVLAVLSGLLLFLSFPKYGSGILAWVALIPLFFALQDAQPREGFKIGFLTGFVAHVGILYWIAYVVVQYGYLPIYVGIAAMLLLSAYLSLYTAFFAFGIVFLRGRGIPLFLSAPLLWTLLEYARSHLLTGFPWEQSGPFPVSFTSNVIQICRYYGHLWNNIRDRSDKCGSLRSVCRIDLEGGYLIAESVTACLLIAVIITYGHFRVADIEQC